MHTKSILIPANPKLLLKGHTLMEKCELTGLLHKNVRMKLARTSMNPEVENKLASEILQYMVNPCIVYDNLTVKGDAILIVESDISFTDANLMNLINSHINFKKNKQMPLDLQMYLDDLISKKKDPLIKQHIKESKDSYGSIKSIPLPESI